MCIIYSLSEINASDMCTNFVSFPQKSKLVPKSKTTPRGRGRMGVGNELGNGSRIFDLLFFF